MSLVVFLRDDRAVGGARPFLHPVLAFTRRGCASRSAAGACGAINMWYDRDIDAIMRRTRGRPIPCRTHQPNAALGIWHHFGDRRRAGHGPGGQSGGRPACWRCRSGFMSSVYTMWLKRRTPQNIVIGGAAGAFPPLIGWAAVTGIGQPDPFGPVRDHLRLDTTAFLSLALFANDDYRRAGVPMLPVVAGAKRTRRQIGASTHWLLVPLSLAPWLLGFSGLVYAARPRRSCWTSASCGQLSGACATDRRTKAGVSFLDQRT